MILILLFLSDFWLGILILNNHDLRNINLDNDYDEDDPDTIILIRL